MDLRKKMFKKKGSAFCDAAIRMQRAEARNNERRGLRDLKFLINRDVDKEINNKEAIGEESIPMKLKKLKIQKIKLSGKSKPPFKCGSVRYDDAKLYQPLALKEKSFLENKSLAPPGFQFKAPEGVIPIPYLFSQSSHSVQRGKLIGKENVTMPTPAVPIRRTPRVFGNSRGAVRDTAAEAEARTEAAEDMNRTFLCEAGTESKQQSADTGRRVTRAFARELLFAKNATPVQSKASIQTGMLCDIPAVSHEALNLHDSYTRPSLLPIQDELEVIYSSPRPVDLISWNSPRTK